LGGIRTATAKGLPWRLLLTAGGLLSLAAALLALSAPASAAGSGDWPPPASGDWWISNPTTVSNETVVVNGTLYVYYTSLSLDNVTLLINSTAGATRGIQVYWAPSVLTVNNSQVTTWDARYRFFWYTYGALRVERSDVQRMADYGIYTYSGNLVMRDNTIHNGSYGGISAYYSDSQPAMELLNNTLYDIDYFAVFLQVYSYYGAGAGPHDLGADFVMRGNTVRDNIGGGI